VTYQPTIYCSRNGCTNLATIEISAGTVDTALRRAVTCDPHRKAVRRWVAFVGEPTYTAIDQPMVGQLSLFPITAVEPKST
jgi:hypothetical protein